MKSAKNTAICMALLGIAMSSAVAGKTPEVLPGLWEMQIGGEQKARFDAQLKQMREQMASLPKAMQEQMMAMMGDRLNMESGALNMCITPAMAKQGPTLPADDEGGCKQRIDWQSNVGKVSIDCHNGSKSSGEIKVLSNKHYTMRGTTKLADGSIEKHQMVGRWVKNSCGKVKPARKSKPAG